MTRSLRLVLLTCCSRLFRVGDGGGGVALARAMIAFACLALLDLSAIDRVVGTFTSPFTWVASRHWLVSSD